MEYWWESVPPDPGTVPAPVPIQNVAGPSETVNKTQPPTNRIAETLQKLINIARLNYRRAKVSEFLSFPFILFHPVEKGKYQSTDMKKE